MPARFGSPLLITMTCLALLVLGTGAGGCESADPGQPRADAAPEGRVCGAPPVECGCVTDEAPTPGEAGGSSCCDSTTCYCDRSLHQWQIWACDPWIEDGGVNGGLGDGGLGDAGAGTGGGPR